MAAWAVLELTDATLTELAVHLKRDVSFMSVEARRFEGLLRISPECEKKVTVLKQKL